MGDRKILPRVFTNYHLPTNTERIVHLPLIRYSNLALNAHFRFISIKSLIFPFVRH